MFLFVGALKSGPFLGGWALKSDSFCGDTEKWYILWGGTEKWSILWGHLRVVHF
jgi:hypothetical protein